MATIKSYTDLEQSKKLVEILPLESADMFYEEVCNLPKAIVGNYILHNQCMEDRDYKKLSNPVLSPAWSLAALLEQLKAEIQLEKNKQILFLHINKYDDINYDIRYTNSWTGEVLIAEADNLIDACVAMIEKLNELKML